VLLYFAIALLGALFLVLSAVLGEVFDFFDGGADHMDGDLHPVSGKTVAVGMTAFGATGMITTYYGWGPLLSALTSALAALLLGAVAWWIIASLFRETASTDVSVSTMVGRRAQVIVSIPAGSVGEVLLATADSTRHMIARSRDGGAIPEGTSVRIVESLGSVVLVEPIDQTAPASGPLQPA
jgi:membrane protein implicated in regulation of membrane protease activity